MKQYQQYQQRQQRQQQQWSLSRVLLLVLLGIYCLCGIAIAIPISDEGDDDYDGTAEVPLFAAKGGGEADALQIAPRGRGGGRKEHGGDLYSVIVVGKRDNNGWGLDGNGNEGGFLALNNNSPVVGGDGIGTLEGKGGDGLMLELTSLSSSSSSSSGGGDSSVSSTSPGNTRVKQQQSPNIDPNALRDIASNPPSNSQASLGAWEARLNAREQQQNLRDQKQDEMAVTLAKIGDALKKQAEDFKKLLDDKIEEDALPLGCTCRDYQPDFDWGGA